MGADPRISWIGHHRRTFSPKNVDAHALPTRELTTEKTATVAGGKQADLLFAPVDHWGYTPITGPPLTPQSVASIITAHLTGASPSHRPYSRRPRHWDTPDVYTCRRIPKIVLDDRYCESGLGFRRNVSNAGRILTARVYRPLGVPVLRRESLSPGQTLTTLRKRPTWCETDQSRGVTAHRHDAWPTD